MNGMTAVPTRPMTTERPRMPAMKASEKSRCDFRYDRRIPSKLNVVR
jgi:hypothetical protein